MKTKNKSYYRLIKILDKTEKSRLIKKRILVYGILLVFVAILFLSQFGFYVFLINDDQKRINYLEKNIDEMNSYSLSNSTTLSESSLGNRLDSSNAFVSSQFSYITQLSENLIDEFNEEIELARILLFVFLSVGLVIGISGTVIILLYIKPKSLKKTKNKSSRKVV